jgi:16S rRNA (guanine527-N7)-methyltransferase
MLSEYRARLTGKVRQTLEHAAGLGMLGTPEIDAQIDHALGFVETFEQLLGRPPRSVVDLGSGGGLPGLVLAEVWPETHVLLLDASERRTEFLKLELGRLSTAGAPGRGSVEVVRGRAEEMAHDERYRERFEGVSARSFGRPAVVAECGAPFLILGGVLVVSEPPEGEAAARWSARGLADVGLAPGDPIRVEERFNYRALAKVGPTPIAYPRRVGVPAKRPLF